MLVDKNHIIVKNGNNDNGKTNTEKMYRKTKIILVIELSSLQVICSFYLIENYTGVFEVEHSFN